MHALPSQPSTKCIFSIFYDQVKRDSSLQQWLKRFVWEVFYLRFFPLLKWLPMTFNTFIWPFQFLSRSLSHTPCHPHSPLSISVCPLPRRLRLDISTFLPSHAWASSAWASFHLCVSGTGVGDWLVHGQADSLPRGPVKQHSWNSSALASKLITITFLNLNDRSTLQPARQTQRDGERQSEERTAEHSTAHIWKETDIHMPHTCCVQSYTMLS